MEGQTLCALSCTEGRRITTVESNETMKWGWQSIRMMNLCRRRGFFHIRSATHTGTELIISQSGQQRSWFSSSPRTAPRPTGSGNRSTKPSKSTPPNNSNNPRILYEDEHHLERSLGNIEVTSQEIRRWEKSLRNKGFDPNKSTWKTAPIETPRARDFEQTALRDIHSLSYDCNVLLEIRDVRLPSSSHHPSFTRLAKHRLHLIAYTHSDLIDKATRDRVEEWTIRSWPESRSIFIDSRNDQRSRPRPNQRQPDEVVETESKKTTAQPPTTTPVFELMYKSLLTHLDTKGGLNTALTVGIANTGKSSVLACLLKHAKQEGYIPKKTVSADVVVPKKKKKKSRKRQLSKKGGAPAVEDKPGKTKTLTEYVIRENPKAFFLDVPGMTPPSFFLKERPEAWYGMVATNLVHVSQHVLDDPDHQTTICEYVLHCLNRDSNFTYVKRLNMDHPTTSIDDVLDKMGGGRINDPDRRRLKQCQNFLKFLNTGNLGPAILDDLSKPYREFIFQDQYFRRKDDAGSDFGNGSFEDDDELFYDPDLYDDEGF